MSLRRRVFALAQLAFALLVLAGSSFELLNLLVPSMLPSIQDIPLMRMHHANRVVFYWTLLSNVVTAGLSLELIRGAIGVFKGSPAASQASRRAIAVFFIVLGGSAAISAVYLFPPIMTMLRSSREHGEGLVLLISVGSSLLGLAVTLACLFAGHDRILRRQAADPGRDAGPAGGAGEVRS